MKETVLNRQILLSIMPGKMNCKTDHDFGCAAAQQEAVFCGLLFRSSVPFVPFLPFRSVRSGRSGCWFESGRLQSGREPKVHHLRSRGLRL